jgi:hypothetical protein
MTRLCPNASILLSVLALLFATTAPVSSQEASAPPPPAAPADVESIDAILKAVYGVISGPAGQKRDWDRFRSLFLPGAKLIPVFKSEEGEGMGHLMWSPEEYVERAASRLEAEGFFEVEIHRVVERFGPVVHLFSTYESRRKADDVKPFARGINSFQLMNDGKRWWVVNIFWTSERPDLPIPENYLPSEGHGADARRRGSCDRYHPAGRRRRTGADHLHADSLQLQSLSRR